MRAKRMLIVAGMATLLLSYAVIWTRFVHDPAEQTGLDFVAFYAAGRIAQEYGAAHVYDSRLQHDVEQAQVGFPLVPGQVLLYNHMPFLIPILRMVVSADYLASFYRWACVLVAAYVLAIASLSRPLRHRVVDGGWISLLGACAFLFLPVFVSLMNGQDTAFLVLGMALWARGLLARRELLAGAGLSLCTVRPHVALVLALPMLFRYPRIFFWFAIGSGLLAALSVAILGIEGSRQLAHLLRLSTVGEWHGMKEDAMYNVMGLLTRSAPQLPKGVVHAVGWLVYAGTILGFCVLWARTDKPLASLIAPTAALALLVAPHLHFHDLAVLLLPIYEWIRTSCTRESSDMSTAAAAVIAVSLVLLLSNVSATFRYGVPLIILLLLALHPYSRSADTPLVVPREP